MNKIISFFLLLFCSVSLFSQDKSPFSKEVFQLNETQLPYRMLLPENYNENKEYPLLLFLHGAGERGNNNESQLDHGSDFLLKINKDYDAIIVVPQCSKEDYWSNVEVERKESGYTFQYSVDEKPTKTMSALMAFLKFIKKEYSVAEDQVYVGGLSMGGMGTFELVYRSPDMFAAAFPVCGGASPLAAEKMKNVAWWVFHGAEDKVVPPIYSENMVNALKKVKASVEFTVYPGVGHDSWNNVFLDPDLLPWLFKQKKN